MPTLAARARALLQIATVALAVHAIVYRSLLPQDGVHGYLGWYAPLIGGLSAAAALATLAIAAAQITGIGAVRLQRIGAVSPPGESTAVATSRLAGTAVAFLVLQESLERSIPARAIEVAQFTPVEWLALLVAVALVSLAFVLAGRGCDLIVRRLRRLERRAGMRRALRRSPPRRVYVAARNPLASFRGLRAPPVPPRP